MPVELFSNAGNNLEARSCANCNSSPSYQEGRKFPKGCSGSIMRRCAEMSAPRTFVVSAGFRSGNTLSTCDTATFLVLTALLINSRFSVVRCHADCTYVSVFRTGFCLQLQKRVDILDEVSSFTSLRVILCYFIFIKLMDFEYAVAAPRH